MTEPTKITLCKTGKEFIVRLEKENQSDGYGDKATKKKLDRQVAALKDLTDTIPQAAFGQGQETKYDKSVRDALQLKAAEFDLNIPSSEMDKILATVKTELNIKTDLIAEPYSLNVYQKGGKFVKHKDTPRGDDMVGTLVICLPSLFRGGSFEISMGSQKSTYFRGSSQTARRRSCRGLRSTLMWTMRSWR